MLQLLYKHIHIHTQKLGCVHFVANHFVQLKWFHLSQNTHSHTRTPSERKSERAKEERRKQNRVTIGVNRRRHWGGGLSWLCRIIHHYDRTYIAVRENSWAIIELKGFISHLVTFDKQFHLTCNSLWSSGRKKVSRFCYLSRSVNREHGQ